MVWMLPVMCHQNRFRLDLHWLLLDSICNFVSPQAKQKKRQNWICLCLVLCFLSHWIHHMKVKLLRILLHWIVCYFQQKSRLFLHCECFVFFSHHVLSLWMMKFHYPGAYMKYFRYNGNSSYRLNGWYIHTYMSLFVMPNEWKNIKI